MKKFFVVGSKTSQSLSPLIFNYWFKKYKIKARYDFLELNNRNFDKKIKEKIKEKDLCGFNITIPFKTKIIKHLNKLDKHSKKINAVNCVLIKSKIIGTNTDWVGYYKTLPKRNNLKKKNIVLIGYGGAALAIHYVLKTKGFKNVIIFNRTKKKLNYEKKTKYTKKIGDLEKYLESADLIINTIPKNPIKLKNRQFVRKEALLSDIVYKPKMTAFLKMFPNNRKIFGISMLIQQAIPSFKMWFGFSPTIDTSLIKFLENKIK